MEGVKFTVFGGAGFIGRHLVAFLESEGQEVLVPERGVVVEPGSELGHVIYCIGLTADFRERPLDTVEAHVHALTRLMQPARFDSWLYLSTTRLYGGLGAAGIGKENTPVSVLPSADSLYDLSKLLGEAICIGRGDPQLRVARLSNVYGPGQSADTFLGSIITEIQRTGTATIREHPQSSKDYIAVGDVVRLLVNISLRGKEQVYNVASGEVTTHREIADRLKELTGKPVAFAAGGVKREFPQIDISRIRGEFGFVPCRLIDRFTDLL